MSEVPPVLDRKLARELDRRASEELGIPSIVLMENAGRGAADLLCRLGINGLVLICCGRGNNAGDGFVVARHLDLRGYPVKVALWADPATLTGDADVNYHILLRSGIPIEVFLTESDSERFAEECRQAAWIVDALLGTGSAGKPRPPLNRAIEAMNASGVPILALDLPSGLDCDTGEAFNPTVRATYTCTFAAWKKGFLAPNAKQYLGQVHVADIGIPRKLLQEVLGHAK
ncbi:MAG: NAD(P)H-hydrate epimerase [Thermoguttaceae bacterium]|nr:NAD(P)H-hydrate epimerase [Thermoguttaceae bacterium]MDW8078509.1 NAD(P)H-hydrate epimerase [Thermoguttaceae bacterium]